MKILKFKVIMTCLVILFTFIVAGSTNLTQRNNFSDNVNITEKDCTLGNYPDINMDFENYNNNNNFENNLNEDSESSKAPKDDEDLNFVPDNKLYRLNNIIIRYEKYNLSDLDLLNGVVYNFETKHFIDKDPVDDVKHFIWIDNANKISFNVKKQTVFNLETYYPESLNKEFNKVEFKNETGKFECEIKLNIKNPILLECDYNFAGKIIADFDNFNKTAEYKLMANDNIEYCITFYFEESF